MKNEPAVRGRETDLILVVISHEKNHCALVYNQGAGDVPERMKAYGKKGVE